MSELMMSNKRNDREFDAHPEGTFMAVCRDVYVERKPNPNAGTVNQWGNPEPEELVRVVFEFLTDEAIEIDGELRPRFISARFNLSWSEKSKLRAFVGMWDPALGRAEEANIDSLCGRGAYLTVTHSPGKEGKVWANVTAIAAPPKGASVPMVPQDFTRRKDRQ